MEKLETEKKDISNTQINNKPAVKHIKTKDEEILEKLKQMIFDKKFLALDKYVDLLDSSRISEETKLQLITNIKFCGNIILTTRLFDFFYRMESSRIREHIVWALQDYRSPGIFKFLKDVMSNNAESADVRIAAALALSEYPDPPPEIKSIIKKIRTSIVHASAAKKNKEIQKLPEIVLTDSATGIKSEFQLKSLTNDYFNFFSSVEMESKKHYVLQFKELKTSDIFMFNTEIIFSVFDQQLGVYINRGHFIKKFGFEKEQLTFIVKGFKNNKLNLENYFMEKNSLNCRVFPCKFHPDYAYDYKNNFYIKNSDDCADIMKQNFYLDTGLDWKKIKCYECRKFLNL